MSDTLLGLLCFALTLLFYYASKWLYGKKRILPLMPLLLAPTLLVAVVMLAVFRDSYPQITRIDHQQETFFSRRARAWRESWPWIALLVLAPVVIMKVAGVSRVEHVPLETGVIYAWMAEESVAAIFAAGYIPALLIGIGMSVPIFVIARKRNYPREPAPTLLSLLDGTSVLRVRMHTSARDAWSSWGRSLPMPDVTSRTAQLVDLFTLLVAQALPLPRLLARRADALDVALLAMRAGTLVGTARAYERIDLAYWLSPLADPAAVLRVVWGAMRPSRSWRGRTYPRSAVPPAVAEK